MTTAVDLDDLQRAHAAAGLVEVDGLALPDRGWTVANGPVSIAHTLGATLFYRHGWNSWSPTGWSPLADSPLRIYGDPGRTLTADDAALDRADAHEGSAVGALELPDGRVLLLGALGLGSPRVGASPTELWGHSENSGADWFIGVGDEAAVFARYAALLADRLGHSTAPRVEALWCSWYSYFEDIDEPLLTSTIAELETLPLDVIQIDDGWEVVVGDWTANSRFPSGMGHLAGLIAAQGATPGLWLAPFIALPSSTIASQHPDWLVSDEAGAPLVAGFNWESHYFALDTTHPAVQQHLRQVFADVVSWGFGYLKLDFLYAGALAGHRHTDAPREQVYRDALALIREVVGPEVYLLGCGAPMIPSIGILDGMRVGPDTASFWSSGDTVPDPSHEGGLNAAVNSVERLWMRDVFQIDPDVAYFRSREIELTVAEKQLTSDLATVAGFRSTSDPVGWLTVAEREQLVRFLDEQASIIQLSRYRYAIDFREVDFGAAVREARLGRERLREVR